VQATQAGGGEIRREEPVEGGAHALPSEERADS
jgi:hypothetical protein